MSIVVQLDKLCTDETVSFRPTNLCWCFRPTNFVCKISLSFRFRISLSDMTNYKSAFGKVCRIKNRQTFKSMPILNSAYHAVKFEWYDKLQIGRLLEVCRIKNRQTFKSMPILNSAYHAVKYAELRIGILLKVCRFVIRHITQTQTETETELLRRHLTFVGRRLDFFFEDCYRSVWKRGRGW